eukprot:TRINITY_DN1483_c0_g1_i3.p1 TRINITY_DN1483_c0_g1~~TRINITY_DN1483_c0_g1_i3.p1  ORF type:complete len:135 (-),score=56.97 TRINITY_DN1483_c0_g1_i3:334-738(-)
MPYNGNESQQFTISSEGFLKNKKSGLILVVSEGSKQGANIIQCAVNGADQVNQRWLIKNDGTITLVDSQLVFDIKGGSREQRSQVIAWPYQNQSNQQWFICNSYNKSIVYKAFIDNQSQTFKWKGDYLHRPELC